MAEKNQPDRAGQAIAQIGSLHLGSEIAGRGVPSRGNSPSATRLKGAPLTANAVCPAKMLPWRNEALRVETTRRFDVKRRGSPISETAMGGSSARMTPERRKPVACRSGGSAAAGGFRQLPCSLIPGRRPGDPDHSDVRNAGCPGLRPGMRASRPKAANPQPLLRAQRSTPQCPRPEEHGRGKHEKGRPEAPFHVTTVTPDQAIAQSGADLKPVRSAR
jgi:hypothetical protein